MAKAPSMMESWLSPYTEAAPKRYLREASRRLLKPPIRLLDMKVRVSSSLYLYRTFQSEYSSKLTFAQNHFMASGVSVLEYCRFHSSRGKVAFGRRSTGCLGLGSAGAASSSSSSFFGAGLAALEACSFLGCSGFLGGVLVSLGASSRANFSA